MSAHTEKPSGPSTAPTGVVVGLGASEGGLRALESFFSRVPPDTGMTFVVAQHLDRQDASSLTEQLRRHARMPVERAPEPVALVALSGYARPEDVARSREAGFDHHVAKPPSLDQLDEILARLPLRPSSRG